MEEILNEYVGTFMANLDVEAVVMHDTGRIVHDYLQKVNINSTQPGPLSDWACLERWNPPAIKLR